MWFRTRLGTAALLISGLALSPPAPAQDAMRWEQRSGEGRIYLAYEVPESSDQSLLLLCDTRSRGFSLRYQDDRDRVRGGMRATVRFASEGGQASVPMRAQVQELGDQVVLDASVPLTPELLRVLSGETLRVTLSGTTESIPLAGARSGIAALAAACGTR
ncbi:hypothetical protein LPC08_20310 [Roseomonas sp. OT10]|uniref:hypothetical protein n=1 Tax=Roseomonas cutis TaxID=2897332 RepID=UPI001E52FC4C|nr:hypothetical protein [Roseomonas sp. OT10]UFN48331.1 hypothetical protein LPC08_20310 [Roseomonas sp. OT10]